MRKLLSLIIVFGLVAGVAVAQNDNKGENNNKMKKKKKAPDIKKIELTGKIFVFEQNGTKTNMIDAGTYGKLELPLKTTPKNIQDYMDKSVKLKVKMEVTHKWNKITEILGIEEIKEAPKG